MRADQTKSSTAHFILFCVSDVSSKQGFPPNQPNPTANEFIPRNMSAPMLHQGQHNGTFSIPEFVPSRQSNIPQQVARLSTYLNKESYNEKLCGSTLCSSLRSHDALMLVRSLLVRHISAVTVQRWFTALLVRPATELVRPTTQRS